MRYKFSIGLDAEAVSALLGQWLESSLPADFTVKRRKHLHFRVIEVTITGSTPEEVQNKRKALSEVLRNFGFRGIVVKDKRIQEK